MPVELVHASTSSRIASPCSSSSTVRVSGGVSRRASRRQFQRAARVPGSLRRRPQPDAVVLDPRAAARARGRAATAPRDRRAVRDDTCEQLVIDRVARRRPLPRTRRGCRRTCSRGRRAQSRPGSVVCDEQAADRQPVRQALGERDRVGAHAELLEREERARAADARLHLVEDEQRAGSSASVARRLDEPRVEGDDPALAEHRLEQDAAGLAGDRGLERRDVVRLRERDTGSSGSNAARFAGWPVTESAPQVRPWNEPSSATTPCLPVALRAYFNAASIASAPELQKNACAPPNRSESCSASCAIGSVQ